MVFPFCQERRQDMETCSGDNYKELIEVMADFEFALLALLKMFKGSLTLEQIECWEKVISKGKELHKKLTALKI
jgi:hypothetical protein